MHQNRTSSAQKRLNAVVLASELDLLGSEMVVRMLWADLVVEWLVAVESCLWSPQELPFQCLTGQRTMMCFRRHLLSSVACLKDCVGLVEWVSGHTLGFGWCSDCKGTSCRISSWFWRNLYKQ
jgi:hypothetical protein